ncbi:MAG: hypothetical protein QF535_07400 [Anaerolineales bacterium]|nr:hypothetical protein [Anaerolineales bacterium]|tara:strand:+ start:1405 stop:1989 length:585 start_codon:yes stop_codon:yes gene_type:complete
MATYKSIAYDQFLSAGGSMVLLQKQEASSSATISFTSGIDDTYKEYVFKFINIHPSVDESRFTFNFSTDSGSNYNVTKTTTAFRAYHDEGDESTALTYHASADLAQSTDFQTIGFGIGFDNDQSLSGFMSVFNPSSTTYVKHFMSNSNLYEDGNFSIQQFIGGYGNTTSAVDAVQFKMESGNIDAGTIKMYGIN